MKPIGAKKPALIQSLSVVDKMLNFKNKQDMKFSNDKIDIELKMKSVEYDLEIPMIEKFGEKGIENLKIKSEKVYSIK